MFTVHLGQNISRQAYVAMLDFVASFATTFILVNVRNLTEDDNLFFQRAQPFLIKKHMANEWSGTVRSGLLAQMAARS